MSIFFMVINNPDDPEFIELEDGQVISTDGMILTGMALHECAEYHNGNKAWIRYHSDATYKIVCEICGEILNPKQNLKKDNN
ncbi:MAG: hypothetical protein Q8O93_05255 [bacterium]|nr:hypothetical protein [bacterium]